MKLRDLLVLTDIAQRYEIWVDGHKQVNATTDLMRYFESHGAPNDEIELNLDSEIKKVYARSAYEYKNSRYAGVLVIDMLEWRIK